MSNDVKPVEHSDKECAGKLLEVVLAVTSSGVIELVEARTVVVPIIDKGILIQWVHQSRNRQCVYGKQDLH